MLPLLAGKAVRCGGAQQLAQLLAPAARAFASDAMTVGQQNPFLRFSSPVPKAIDHSPLLSTLPETKVQCGVCSNTAKSLCYRAAGVLCALDAGGVFHSPLARGPLSQVTTLPNGLRVATEHLPFAETTTLGVWINSGSRFETDETNGAAHFLEHILFKGTKAGLPLPAF